MTTDYERLSIALERGDDETAMIRAFIDHEVSLANGTAATADGQFTQGGILSADGFASALGRESARCLRTRDPIAVLVVALERELEAEEDLRLAMQLRELAGNTGDLVGRVENGYAVALPWIDDREMRPLARTFEAMVRSIARDQPIRVGAISAVPTQEDLESFAMPALRRPTQPAVTRSRGR